MSSPAQPLSNWFSLIERLALSPEFNWEFRCLVCSTLILACTWLAVLLSSRRSSALRHRILTLGFVGLLLVPLALLGTSGNHLTFAFPLSSSSYQQSSTGIEFPPTSANRSNLPWQQHEAPTMPFEPPGALPQNQAAELVTSVVAPRIAGPQIARETAEATPAAVSLENAWLQRFAFIRRIATIPILTAVVWGLGVIISGGKLVAEWFLVRRILSHSVTVLDGPTLELLDDVRRVIHTGRRTASGSGVPRPPLFCSTSIPVPIAAGLISPCVILPAGFGKWPESRLRLVLLHELAHLDRHDILANLLARLGCLMFWFNPLAWMAARRMQLEQEIACDNVLLETGANAAEYADELCQIASTLQRRWQTVSLVMPMATPSHLQARVRHLMQSDHDRQSVATRESFVAAVLAGLAVLFLAVCSPSLGSAQAATEELNQTEVVLAGEVSSDWFRRLDAMPKLRKLTIRNPSLQNLKLTQLGGLKQITEFIAEDFSIDSRLADLVAINIARLPALRTVQFRRTGLTERGLQALRDSAIESLTLEGEEQLQNPDFQHIAAIPTLRNLVLDSTPVEADGLTTLQSAPQLRRLAILRHPSGTYQEGSRSRIQAISGITTLEELDLGDVGYSELAPLKANKSLRRLTLRHSGGKDALKTLQQLTQLKQVEFEDSDLFGESFADLITGLAGTGIRFADLTQTNRNLLGSGGEPDEPTRTARQALQQFNLGRQVPAFWITWTQHWSKIPTMVAVPVRTEHRLKQALTAASDRQPWGQEMLFAFAPGELYLKYRSDENGVVNWERILYADAELATSREGSLDKPPLYVIRSGVEKFEDTIGMNFPRQLEITHQSMWWGTPNSYRITSSPVSPESVTYLERSEEDFAGEICRVFQAPGRSETLWVSKATGRLRGCLHYIHQGYFIPFFKQDVVTQLLGRRIESIDDYRQATSDSNSLSPEIQSQLSQAWAEYEFSHAYPGSLYVFDDYREIAKGKWFPFQVRSSGWLHNSDNSGRYDYHNALGVVTEVAVDRNNLASYWQEVRPANGAKIQDQRYDTAVDYTFTSDVKPEAIQDLVNQRLLENARSQAAIDTIRKPFDEMVGKPAPALPDQGWIGKRPDVKGKGYLIHFWAGWCGPCKNDVPLLNALAKNGIVIGIHPGDRSADQTRKSMDEAGMTYPTILAPEGAANLLGYPTGLFPYCVEVDEQGLITRHGFLEEVLGLRSGQNTNATASDKSPDNPSKDVARMKGSILAVDAENGLTVISLGKRNGLQINQLLTVQQPHRTNPPPMQLRVLIVHENRSIAKITGNPDNQRLAPGLEVLTDDTMPVK